MIGKAFFPAFINLAGMELSGKWTKNEDGYMEFDSYELQRNYEAITDRYHQVYNHYLEENEDDDAYFMALDDGYKMETDYKIINGSEEFTTTYTTPTHIVDVWYEFDELKKKKVYERGFVRIRSK